MIFWYFILQSAFLINYGWNVSNPAAPLGLNIPNGGEGVSFVHAKQGTFGTYWYFLLETDNIQWFLMQQADAFFAAASFWH